MPPALSSACNARAIKRTDNSRAMPALKVILNIDPPGLQTTAPVQICGLYGHNAKQNSLLAALPEAEYQRLLPHLEFVSMPFNMLVSDTNSSIVHAYFPTSSIVSILYATCENASLETAVIGNEGLVGLTALMGGGSSLNRAFVKSAGYGFRIPARLLAEEFNRSPVLQRSLLRFTQALITQMSQNAVCNRHHSVGQQLCRFLLFSLDRLPSNELNMTQELIAKSLGVRRESIAEAAGNLQEKRLINYRRGHITVLNRTGLESCACGCYANVKAEYDRLLHGNMDLAI